jgi:two-component system chemotaxis response regulator CheY
MKALIVEDDFLSRMLLQGLLKPYVVPDIAVNGKEAVEAVRISLENKEPYNLICMDIMMPEMDGQEALRHIRDLEKMDGILPTDGVKVIMITALDDKKNIMTAFREQCDTYLVKPLDKTKLVAALETLKLI